MRSCLKPQPPQKKFRGVPPSEILSPFPTETNGDPAGNGWGRNAHGKLIYLVLSKTRASRAQERGEKNESCGSKGVTHLSRHQDVTQNESADDSPGLIILKILSKTFLGVTRERVCVRHAGGGQTTFRSLFSPPTVASGDECQTLGLARLVPGGSGVDHCSACVDLPDWRVSSVRPDKVSNLGLPLHSRTSG